MNTLEPLIFLHGLKWYKEKTNNSTMKVSCAHPVDVGTECIKKPLLDIVSLKYPDDYLFMQEYVWSANHIEHLIYTILIFSSQKYIYIEKEEETKRYGHRANLLQHTRLHTHTYGPAPCTSASRRPRSLHSWFWNAHGFHPLSLPCLSELTDGFKRARVRCKDSRVGTGATAVETWAWPLA